MLSSRLSHVSPLSLVFAVYLHCTSAVASPPNLRRVAGPSAPPSIYVAGRPPAGPSSAVSGAQAWRLSAATDDSWPAKKIDQTVRWKGKSNGTLVCFPPMLTVAPDLGPATPAVFN